MSETAASSRDHFIDVAQLERVVIGLVEYAQRLVPD